LAYIAVLHLCGHSGAGPARDPDTSFIAVIGAAGLAVGLALQGSLANFAQPDY